MPAWNPDLLNRGRLPWETGSDMVYRLRSLVDGFVSLTLSDRDLEVVEASGVRHGSPFGRVLTLGFK